MEEILAHDPEMQPPADQFTQVDIAADSESNISSSLSNDPAIVPNAVPESPIAEKSSRNFLPTASQLEELGRVELSAHECAKNFTDISARLRANLLVVSSNSEKYMDAYKLATENLQEQVNESLVAMHTLITKCQELNVDFKRIHEMAAEVKAIRKDVDTLYALIGEK
jgi:hypothetical protein